ncbi:PAC2 family protein [Corynebacterium sp. zg-331]|uniref:PAC2 family protein n=1 Tax=unclassified Corynebacterium TaxID=2624378 RepID=UPI00128D3C53|nr:MULTISPECIES: PAC2 family protein [unclassified Corynebacterium]MBC3185405.1 PAC2 family protein [Corynebacterium sp. zg-331]MPV51900.1 PAC2 family protein [Corynebacterium sp. zg331]
MPEEHRHMYELEYPTPEVSSDGSSGPTLIVALHGYADAGQAVSASADHLLAALENRLLASFNTDELIDYRSRRPTVTMENHEVTKIEKLALEMRVLRDTKGQHFLLLSGPEPDLRWDSFTHAVAGLVRKYNVSRVVCLYSAPMMVPHTRPLVVSAHGTSPELMQDLFHFDGSVMMPGSAALQLESVLGQQHTAVAGFTAHVPHYVSSSAYPEATLKLLRSVAHNANLELPLQTLEHDWERAAQQLTEQVEGSAEIQHVVAALEQQYDEEVEQYRTRHPKAALPGEEDLPSGEEIGQEFERFLANLDEEE